MSFAAVTCCILMAIVFVGTSFESKMQMGLLVILTLSIIDYFIGTFVPVSDSQTYRGITGYSCKLISQFFTFYLFSSSPVYSFVFVSNFFMPINLNLKLGSEQYLSA